MTSSWVTSLIVIRDLGKFSIINMIKLREFPSDHLALL